MELEKIGTNQWQVEKQPPMQVDAVIFAKQEMLPQIKEDLSLKQLSQAASLPNLLSPVVGLPDIHQGFGLPIGGVMTAKNLVSSGAVGMDINCGVRLLKTPFEYDPKRFTRQLFQSLISSIEKSVPVGLGRSRKGGLPNKLVFDKIITDGVQHLADKGYATQEDVSHCEEYGKMADADIASLSKKAISRARSQLGTLGSGNHFIEIQKVDEIFDSGTAEVFGLSKNQVCVMIHCGSRALGHQTCLDYTKKFAQAASKYSINYPTRNLASLPADSKEGKGYLSAMAGCVNFAFSNRQFISYKIRQVFEAFFRKEKPQLDLVYDVAHNIAKWEKHQDQKVLVHRKGATRALPAGHPKNPKKYAQTGHPALVPGSMGTPSFVMIGLPNAKKTYFSINHGAGRTMSRKKAKKTISKQEFVKKMGEIVYNKPFHVIADEAPQAYKDINLVTDTLTEAGIAKKVAQLSPLAVIKGN